MTQPLKYRHFVFLWAWPIALGLLTAIGLVAALFSDDGWGDHLAALCLGIPVLMGLWFGWLRRQTPRRTDPK